jgi:glycosyltransferase involved in cell wall biosynthesis
MITWISWEKHRRTKELCDYLGIENKVFASSRSRLLRHPAAVFNTVRYLFQQCPKTLIVQCPSIFLGLLACLLKPILRYRLIVDAHSDALTPDKKLLQQFFFLYRFIHRTADVVVVTNEENITIVKESGGRAVVVPDRLFDPPVLTRRRLEGKHTLAFVCSFDVDEPYKEVFEAFCSFPETTLYVTGRTPEHVLEAYKHQKNIIFTGYTPLNDYLTLLQSVDGILALTTRENTTLCAANEAVSFTQPLILSDTKFLRSYFSKGSVYTANTAEGIRAAYQTFLNDQERLKTEMIAFKPQLSRAWEEKGETFKTVVYGSKSELKKVAPAAN